MATNLDLDPELLDRAFALSGAPSKKAAVTAALQEFIARRELAGLPELFQEASWDPTYDHKADRRARDHRHEGQHRDPSEGAGTDRR